MGDVFFVNDLRLIASFRQHALTHYPLPPTPAFVADALRQRESSTISPLIAQRSSTGSAASNSPATHKSSAGFHWMPVPRRWTRQGTTPSAALL